MKPFFTKFLFLAFFSASGLSAGEVNFSEHIAPIIYKHCTSCHRSGEIAPFTLENYADAKLNAQAIAGAVSSGHMPPWMPAHGYGEFADVRRLSGEQIAMIVDWVKQGAPEGDPSKAPAPPQFSSGSQLGTPDLVLTMSEAYTLKGDGKDDYRNFVLPTNLLAGRNVRAIEFRPGNARIVHHALIFLDTKQQGRALDAAEPGPGYSGFGGPGFDPDKSLLGWVPGATPRFFPQNIGFSIPKGADIVVQLHYAPSDTKESDRSSINIFFASDPTIREIQQSTISPENLDIPFRIPAGQKRSFRGVLNVPVDVSLMMTAPHMHLLGTEARAYAVTPAADTIPLIWIREWDFHWQGYYAYKHLVKIPKGSKIYYEASYDNTADNPHHPTPDNLKEVRWGESTLDEMFLSYFFWLPYRNGDENITTETATGVAEEFYPGNVLQMSVSPNPAEGDEATVNFYLPASAAVQVELYDLRGERLAILAQDRIFDAGPNSLKLSLGGLPGGSYICRLRSGNSSVTGRLSIVR